MPAKKSRLAQVRAQQKQLARYGFDTSHGSRKLSNVSRRVNRALAKIKPYTGTAADKFVFRPLPKSERARAGLKETLAKKQKTPGGFFFRVPEGVKKKDFRITVTRDGDLVTKGRGPAGGRREEITRALDPVALAKDPQAAFAALSDRLTKSGKVKEPLSAYLMVNGHQGKMEYTSFAKLLQYAAGLMARLSAKSKAGRGKKEKRMTPAQLAEVFSVKLIYQSSAKKSRRARK